MGYLGRAEFVGEHDGPFEIFGHTVDHDTEIGQDLHPGLTQVDGPRRDQFVVGFLHLGGRAGDG